MTYSFGDFFTNPLLAAPTIGSMLMCFIASLIGVILLMQKRVLIGETLSHAAYPGVVLGVISASVFLSLGSPFIALFILLFAALFSFLAIYCLNFFERHKMAASDSALCLILSLFFGFGVLLASRVQLTHSAWYNQIQIYLYGQVATMVASHIWIYAIFALLTLLIVILFYHQIRATTFDPLFARTVGIKVSFIEYLLALLLVVAVTLGIRTVGVVLMSGMLIAPAVSARCYTDRFSHLFILSAIFGAFSGFCGNYLSLAIPHYFDAPHLLLPTGPLVFLSAASILILSLLFAPKKGAFSRLARRFQFKSQTALENILKAIAKNGPLTKEQIGEGEPANPLIIYLVLQKAKRDGWTVRDPKGRYKLTSDGKIHAARIIRLHRLWEVYLVDYLGQGASQVHPSAEKMEHVLSGLENELTRFLKRPRKDPHGKTICYTKGRL